jgi:hypothetical protein
VLLERSEASRPKGVPESVVRVTRGPRLDLPNPSMRTAFRSCSLASRSDSSIPSNRISRPLRPPAAGPLGSSFPAADEDVAAPKISSRTPRAGGSAPLTNMATSIAKGGGTDKHFAALADQGSNRGASGHGDLDAVAHADALGIARHHACVHRRFRLLPGQRDPSRRWGSARRLPPGSDPGRLGSGMRWLQDQPAALVASQAAAAVVPRLMRSRPPAAPLDH